MTDDRRPLTPDERALVRIMQRQMDATSELIQALKLADLRPLGVPEVEATIRDAVAQAEAAIAEVIAAGEALEQGRTLSQL